MLGEQQLRPGNAPSRHLHRRFGRKRAKLWIKTSGTLACWGNNSEGQATAPAGTYTIVSAGDFHTCAIKTDGTLACWGFNGAGQTNAPTGTYTALAAGQSHNCAIKTAGSLACWGNNTFGQASPPSGTYIAVAAGNSHSCAIRISGFSSAGARTTPARESRRQADTAPSRRAASTAAR